MENTFAENIIELKIIADRLVQGVGKNAGTFSVKYQILFLVEKKGVNSPKGLIEELGIAKSNLALACNSLVNEGLLEKSSEDGNKKKIYYKVTEIGKLELYKKCEPIDLIAEISKNKTIEQKSKKLADLAREIKNS